MNCRRLSELDCQAGPWLLSQARVGSGGRTLCFSLQQRALGRCSPHTLPPLAPRDLIRSKPQSSFRCSCSVWAFIAWAWHRCRPVGVGHRWIHPSAFNSSLHPPQSTHSAPLVSSPSFTPARPRGHDDLMISQGGSMPITRGLYLHPAPSSERGRGRGRRRPQRLEDTGIILLGLGQRRQLETPMPLTVQTLTGAPRGVHVVIPLGILTDM